MRTTIYQIKNAFRKGMLALHIHHVSDCASNKRIDFKQEAAAWATFNVAQCCAIDGGAP